MSLSPCYQHWLLDIRKGRSFVKKCIHLSRSSIFKPRAASFSEVIRGLRGSTILLFRLLWEIVWSFSRSVKFYMRVSMVFFKRKYWAQKGEIWFFSMEFFFSYRNGFLHGNMVFLHGKYAFPWNCGSVSKAGRMMQGCKNIFASSNTTSLTVWACQLYFN